MKITFMAKKGGVGKSTLSLMVYHAWSLSGQQVAIHDWDIQGTSTKSLSVLNGVRAEFGKTYDHIIFDTPPRLDHDATRLAVKSSDVVLVVTTPSPADIWEASDTLAFAQETNPNAQVRVVFNMVKKRTRLGKLIEKTIDRLELPALKNTVGYRECFQHALGHGWAVLDDIARKEILHLTIELSSLTGQTQATLI